MNYYHYIIPLPPVSKKNSQQIMVNRATGRPFIMPSKKYREYEREASCFLNKCAENPLSCRVNIKCHFYLPTRRRTDIVNLLEAVDDLLVHAKIIQDDHYGIVASHDGSRCFLDKEKPRTEIWIEELGTDEGERMDRGTPDGGVCEKEDGVMV